ncbi:MAG: galactose mutarotase [Reichenbachiella sp.]
MRNALFICIIFLIISASCQKSKKSSFEKISRDYFAVEQSEFGILDSGQKVFLYTLKSPSGMEISIMNYGAVITSWLAPNNKGVFEDVVLGFENVKGYIKNPSYFGAVVGRYGNRIAKGQFSIEGESYQLAINNEPNNLHGGVTGFDKVIWNVKEFVTDSSAGLILNYESKDMEEGFPGNLPVEVIYTLDGQNSLTIEYVASTNKTTHVNLTQHSYFNLSGDLSRDILGHELMINAYEYTPVNESLIPDRGIVEVVNTPFDFNTPTIIGSRINVENEQLKKGNGYDHNWVLNPSNQDEDGMTLAAILTDSISGRMLEVLTTEPGIQFYSGNFLNSSIIGKLGKTYDRRYGLCLETQHFPDTPNQPDFPTTLLKPGEEYRTKTIYRFKQKK